MIVNQNFKKRTNRKKNLSKAKQVAMYNLIFLFIFIYRAISLPKPQTRGISHISESMSESSASYSSSESELSSDGEDAPPRVKNTTYLMFTNKTN